MKRIGHGCGCLLLALVVLAGLCCGGGYAARRLRERPVYGPLSHAEELRLPLQMQTGPFLIEWRPEAGGKITVSHEEFPDHVLWSTVPGIGFVGAASGRERVTEHRGMFFFRDRIRRRYPNQYIERIYTQDGAIHIVGRLATTSGRHPLDYSLVFEARGDARLGFVLDVAPEQANRLYLNYASDADEGFYGFGAQFTHFDLKGRRVPIFVMEQGIGRGRQPLTFLVDLVARSGGAWHTTYAAAPHYLTSAMRSLFLETHGYSVFDLRAPDRVQLGLFGSRLTGGILAGDTPAALIRAYTDAVGRMRPLPDWILEGAVVGMQGGTEKARHVWEALQRHETPVAAFWLQDWVGQRTTIVGKQLWWNWELDRDHYPGWEALLEDWARQEVRVMTYVNPFLIDAEAKGNYQRNLFKEALTKNYLIQAPGGGPYLVKNTDFSAAMLDLSNPDAWDWMKGVMHEQVVAVGASGWMADFGEALPYDAILHSGEPAAEYHNRYPEAWAQLNREVIEETGQGDDYVFFMRSGYRESPRHATLFWLGDQMVTWDRHDGMKSAVTGLLSSGMSGYAFSHSDIGGYTAVVTPFFTLARDRELLMRWMELNAFSVVFRTHEGIAPDANHQVYTDEATLAHFSRCARIYIAWQDYRKRLVQEAAETGLPVARHPFIHYPQDRRVRNITYEQFMVGEVFMVAPALEPGVTRVDCYLPEGRWTHLWSRKNYVAGETGLDVSVDAPLGQPAVFYQAQAPEALDFLDNLKRLEIMPEK